MKTGQIKFFCWLAAMGLAGYLGLNIYEFWKTHDEWRLGLASTDDMELALTDVERIEPKKANIVPYTKVKASWHTFDWTGKPPPKVVEKAADDTPKEKPKTPVSDLVAVMMMRVDTSDETLSGAFILYKPAANMPLEAGLDGQHLRKGDTLYEPHDHIKVDALTADGIVFVFTNDSEREKETVAPDNTSESLITYTDAAGVKRPGPRGAIAYRPGKSFVPKETVERRPNEFLIGLEDRDQIAENYPTILTHDVRHRRHRDPKTGKFDGIEIQSVAPGSIAARHGAQSGDIIRSINGHSVTSVAEAVSFVKNNQDQYDTWVVEIENQGKIRTVTYQSPPDN